MFAHARVRVVERFHNCGLVERGQAFEGPERMDAAERFRAIGGHRAKARRLILRAALDEEALRSAALFAKTSSNSLAGTLSETMPAPA